MWGENSYVAESPGGAKLWDHTFNLGWKAAQDAEQSH